MSRRRITQKLCQASLKEESAPPVSTEGQAAPTEAGKLGDSVARQHENPLESALGPWLASEAARRAASEERTADTLGRYFKATVAILCLNMVVGGANVAVSFMNAGEPRTVVVTQPAPTAGSQATPASAPSLSGTVPAATNPSSQASTPTTPTTPPLAATPPPSPVPLLGKVPRFGKPGEPDARPSRSPAVTRPARTVTAPARIRPPTVTDEAVEGEPDPEPSHLAAERW